ncbi:family 10 glycosylhydrolase [Paenalkalicoccus suaedae]|uniref:Family 10 glycosylhydrolase n=1 Tax=Paenalkalicoccus suaedae TaxID=2592382 RepID=A0A859FJ04_9BACI|nr:alpha amylase family protein [Paenalkalicoccus suaedae]QKS72854.1 family 10 glycosylhydrolase [Paenalkalicoccus suaedae]
MKKAWIFVMTLLLVFVTWVPSTYANSGQSNAVNGIVNNPNMKARILWYDLSANLFALDTREKVEEIVEKTANANIETIILDVKNPSGFVAYDSDIAPHVGTSVNPRYQGYDPEYDLMATVIDVAKDYDLEVHASINVFSEGSTVYREGPAFDNPDWQTTLYQPVRFLELASGETRQLTAINAQRGDNQLVLYSPDAYEVSPANRWGVEVQVTDGVVTEISDRANTGAPALAVPENGYVLSGHGIEAQWLRDNLSVGTELTADNMETRLIKAEEGTSPSTFVNPINQDVQQYELSLLEEIITNYDVDGVVLDRARYNNIFADFSEESRVAFEAWLGESVPNFPEDIYTFEFDGNDALTVPGTYYKEWIEWRASNIQDFFAQAENLVHSLDNDVLFSTYVGAWYQDYYNEGVNWASRHYEPDYDWASDSYHTTGYAELLDFIMVGTYFEDVTKEDGILNRDNPDYSVEGSAEIAMEVVNNATFVYGSLYLLQYQNDPERFREAIRMDLELTHGIMLFDLVYLEMYDWWHIVEEELAQPKRTPHQIPGLLKQLRKDR